MAFVRVKRRHDEDPYNSIVVSHKKPKSVGSVFQFAATLKYENENLSQILKDVREGKSVKHLTKMSKNKSTIDVVEHSKSQRLKVVNALRAVKQDTVPIDEKGGESSEIKVVDFIIQTEDNRKPLIDEGISIDYVYDLYYASNNNEKSIDIQDIDSVHGLDSDKFYNICNTIDTDESSDCEDEDDSNDECNWRNDYPDEDEMENSDGDCDDLVVCSKQWHLNSSSSNSNVEDDENSDDEDNLEDYNVRFARYKQRVKAEEHYYYNSVVEESPSSDSDV